MQKKKVAFVMGTLYMGGAERALINMLKFFDYEHYDVTLWICGKEKGNVRYINEHVRIEHVESEFSKRDSVKSNNHIKAMYCRFKAKMNIADDEKNKYYYSMSLPKISDMQYDCVIAYRGWDASILRFAFNRIQSKKKIIWMHGDTIETGFPFSYYYQRADKIYCVSYAVMNNTRIRYQVLSEKLEVFYNILDKEDILKKSTGRLTENLSHPALLSVGRLSWEKGFEIIPQIAYILKTKGYIFQWYIIGEGYKRDMIESNIEKYNVSDIVILLGEKNNPYPYFKNCDYFVQTSLTEGYCITTAEAKLFCKPVVTSNLPVMYEQFVNRKNGIIVDKQTAESYAESIEELLINNKLCKSILNNLKSENQIESNTLEKFYHYINT